MTDAEAIRTIIKKQGLGMFDPTFSTAYTLLVLECLDMAVAELNHVSAQHGFNAIEAQRKLSMIRKKLAACDDQ